MALDRAAVINRIQAILEGSTTPALTVIVGSPVGLPADGSPYATFAYRGRQDPPEGGMTLQQRMNSHRFEVSCFWHIRPETVSLEALENEIWQACDTLRAAFWGDFTLNGEATALSVGDTTSDEEFFPIQAARENRVVLYRTLSFDLFVTDLEGEAISP